MRYLLVAAALFAACKSKAPEVAAPAAPPADGQPAPAPMMDKNEAEKYVKGLRDDVKKAEAAREKAAK